MRSADAPYFLRNPAYVGDYGGPFPLFSDTSTSLSSFWAPPTIPPPLQRQVIGNPVLVLSGFFFILKISSFFGISEGSVFSSKKITISGHYRACPGVGHSVRLFYGRSVVLVLGSIVRCLFLPPYTRATLAYFIHIRFSVY